MIARAKPQPDPTPHVPETFDDRGIAGHPRGLSNLFFAEMWERFSFYGMRALLMLFMVAPVATGGLGLDQVRAAEIYGNYTMACYLLCILGGYVADNFIGARRAVLVGGLIITAGHYTLAVDSLVAFYTGLGLVAVGTGLLKPSISTLVGGLYRSDDARRDAGFSIFYMGINLGAFAAPLVTGWLAQSERFREILAGWGLDPNGCWHWGFGAAAIGMTLGMVVYVRRLSWLGKVGEAPSPGKKRPWKGLLWVALGSAALLGLLVRADRFPALLVTLYSLPLVGIAYFGLFRKDEEGRRMGAILVFFVAAILFWAVFEQAGSTLALFAEELTRNEVLGHAFPSSWFQSVNALFVMMLAPVFAWLWVRMGRNQPSVPAKFALGLLFLGLSFALMVPAAAATAAGKVSPLWLLGVYLLQTVGEMCLSPVGLSAMSRLAPAHLAGLVMGVWFLATSLGNKLAGTLSAAFDAKDPGALSDFFLNQALVVGVMTVALFALAPWVRRLMGR